jgi:hypothetical protein
VRAQGPWEEDGRGEKTPMGLLGMNDTDFFIRLFDLLGTSNDPYHGQIFGLEREIRK